MANRVLGTEDAVKLVVNSWAQSKGAVADKLWRVREYLHGVLASDLAALEAIEIY